MLERWPSIAVALVVLCAVVVALVRYPDGIRSLNNRAGDHAEQTETDRQLAITDPLRISKPFVLAALRIVPPDATYAVRTGAAAPRATALTLAALPRYLENLLLPRVRAGRPQWILCYGCAAPDRPPSVAWSRGSLAIGRAAR